MSHIAVRVFKVHGFLSLNTPPDRAAKLKVIFLISQPEHMMLVLKRAASVGSSFEHPKHIFGIA